MIVNLENTLNRRTFSRICFTARTGSDSPMPLWIWSNFAELDSRSGRSKMGNNLKFASIAFLVTHFVGKDRLESI